MPFNQQSFDTALAQNDKALASSLCDELVKEIYHHPDQFSVAQLEKWMKDLRAKRMFTSMRKLGDACMQTSKASYKIRRQLAQALIEEGIFSAAIHVLEDIIQETEHSTDATALFENREAHGLMGRAYKQLYVVADNPANPMSVEYMNKAIAAYQLIYEKNPSENIWHGINTVAMAARAKSDGVALKVEPKIDEWAGAIVQIVEKMEANENAQAFDLATALEATVALGKPKDAINWLNKYIQSPQADAFEFASTLRQLTELWRLDAGNTELGQIIPLLRGALLKKEGGTLTISASEIQDGIFNKEQMLPKPEKVFGADSYQTYEWYMKGAQRCLLIARIGREKTKGFGTGFLMNGADLHPDLANEMVLLTNAHVVTNDPNEREALRPEEALVSFEVLGIDKTYTIKELFFTSPFNDFDVTILRFKVEDETELKNIIKGKAIDLFAISKKNLDRNGNERVYIIGHPAGGILQLSLQDNALLDYEGRLLHYRTPTVGGSSGSPVFDDNWNLIGIHHAGGNYIRKLNNEKGMYQANEGIRITFIQEALKNKNP